MRKQNTMQPLTATAPTDFDFMIGNWNVHHRRLNSRLTGCTTWTEFHGTSSTQKFLGGFGNVEDNILCFPGAEVGASWETNWVMEFTRKKA